MNESSHNKNLVLHLRSAFSQGVVFKHADAFTVGIPDISLTVNGRVVWLEGKQYVVIDDSVTFEDVLRHSGKHWMVQLETMNKIRRAGALAIYIIWLIVGRKPFVVIESPDVLTGLLNQRVTTYQLIPGNGHEQLDRIIVQHLIKEAK